SVVVDLQTKGDKLVAEFAQSHLPAELERRLDVTDFATPVRTIDSLNADDTVRIIIAPEGQYEYLAYQVGNVYTIDVKPPVKVQADRLTKETEYTGEKLSLNFQNIDVRAVLQLIGDFTGLNMVASDTVQGNLTLRLKNVPWDQALEIILKAKGLAMRKNGNVVLVAPSEEIAAREKLELEAGQQIQELAPLHTEFFQINYAKAEEVSKLLKAEGNSLLSKRGNITVDARTNTLMILDTSDKLDEIRKVIARLDIPIRQVLIESRIVIASDQFSKDIGARFGVSRIAKNGGNGMITNAGSLEATTTSINQGFTNSTVAGSTGIWDGPIRYGALGDRLNVDLAVSEAPRFGLAILGSDYLVDLELSAMQSEGKGEVVSSPRVVTANQKEAKIEQGVEIPYLQATSSGATSVAFKKATLSLGVTPQITPDDRVVMDLKVNKDNVGEVFNGVPSINTRNVDTQVLVNNGATVVLGGIYEQTRSQEVDKVPLLGDLPLVGALFRQTRKVDDKAELLIFVTPKILKDTTAAAALQ
ncbi:MAG TPA: type IV pilus secretin PilQ family protein, partial [Fibrobacteria bacterium]|nr:type IV pilus secretin PilQ family protein [Fibrobacteria bacterium]